VQANILAATTRNRHAMGEAFNVGLGSAISLTQLHELISEEVAASAGVPIQPAKVGPPREGDLLKSVADIHRITDKLGFEPDVDLPTGLAETVRWYASRRKKR